MAHPRALIAIVAVTVVTVAIASWSFRAELLRAVGKHELAGEAFRAQGRFEEAAASFRSANDLFAAASILLQAGQEQRSFLEFAEWLRSSGHQWDRESHGWERLSKCVHALAERTPDRTTDFLCSPPILALLRARKDVNYWRHPSELLNDPWCLWGVFERLELEDRHAELRLLAAENPGLLSRLAKHHLSKNRWDSFEDCSIAAGDYEGVAEACYARGDTVKATHWLEKAGKPQLLGAWERSRALEVVRQLIASKEFDKAMECMSGWESSAASFESDRGVPLIPSVPLPQMKERLVIECLEGKGQLFEAMELRTKKGAELTGFDVIGYREAAEQAANEGNASKRKMCLGRMFDAICLEVVDPPPRIGMLGEFAEIGLELGRAEEVAQHLLKAATESERLGDLAWAHDFLESLGRLGPEAIRRGANLTTRVEERIAKEFPRLQIVSGRNVVQAEGSPGLAFRHSVIDIRLENQQNISGKAKIELVFMWKERDIRSNTTLRGGSYGISGLDMLRASDFAIIDMKPMEAITKAIESSKGPYKEVTARVISFKTNKP